MKESSTYQWILKEGREEGVVIGRQEGRTEEARNLILRLGGKRFGAPDADTQTRLAIMTEPEQLERLAERLFEAENWKEFWD